MKIYVTVANVSIKTYNVELENENASSLKYRATAIHADKNGYRCGHKRTNIRCCVLVVIWKSSWFDWITDDLKGSGMI